MDLTIDGGENILGIIHNSVKKDLSFHLRIVSKSNHTKILIPVNKKL